MKRWLGMLAIASLVVTVIGAIWIAAVLVRVPEAFAGGADIQQFKVIEEGTIRGGYRLHHIQFDSGLECVTISHSGIDCDWSKVEGDWLVVPK